MPTTRARPCSTCSQLRVLLIDRRSFGFERTIDQLTAGQWIRHALEPMTDEKAGPITIVEAEPAALDVADLPRLTWRSLPARTSLARAGWAMLAGVHRLRGGLLVTMPPAEVNGESVDRAVYRRDGVALANFTRTCRSRRRMAMAVEQPASEILRIDFQHCRRCRCGAGLSVLPVEANAEASKAATAETTSPPVGAEAD